jgi:hypothetical protein
MKLKLLALAGALVLAGCASGPSSYQLYAETQKAIAQANAVAETARYNALAEIAKNGDSAAKVAAVLSIQMGGGSNQRPQQQVAAPESIADTALKWTSVLLPSFAQLYTVQRNTAVAMRQSDNQAAIAISTNKAFTDISTAGHTANSSIASSGFTAINQSSTAGFNALGTQSTTAFNSLQGVSIAGFNALKDTAGMIQTPSPNITVEGNYNVGANSGNSGKLAGTTLTDSTATPTVVNQPSPVVVNQPSPTVVNPVVVTQPAPLIVKP